MKMVRLAATVMLVRPAGRAGMEVFMLRRSEASHFVPDVYVFPGGTVDEADLSDRAIDRARGIEPERLRREFRAQPAALLPAPLGPPDDREAAALLFAAVRELYEEAGVLLVCDAFGNALPEIAPAQREPFPELLERLDAYADCNALALFSQWITPPGLPRRYNAHFFVARACEGQIAVADAFETHDGVWIAPRTALERCAAGDFRMVYPTIKHVERLAEFDTPQALMHFAHSKTIYTIMPQVQAQLQFTLPPELESAW